MTCWSSARSVTARSRAAVEVVKEEAPRTQFGSSFKENLLQFAGIDGAAVGGKTDFQPEQQIPCFGIELAGGPLEDFLSAAADRDQPAVAGSLGLIRGRVR